MRISRTLVPVLVASALPMMAAGGGAVPPTASAAASASAKIYQPISIKKTSDLNFGAMIATPNSGKVVLDTAGVRTASGGAVLASAAGVAAASFQVDGEPNVAYNLALPASISITSGGNSMTVDTFTSDAATTQLDSKGTQAFNVGASLSVGANQAAGLYSGSFSVTVAYN